jgi:hypothetical protein
MQAGDEGARGKHSKIVDKHFLSPILAQTFHVFTFFSSFRVNVLCTSGENPAQTRITINRRTNMARTLVPALALAAITPFASAITLEDADGNSLGFGIRLQNRIDFNQGINNSAGDPVTDTAGVNTVDFYLRRVRLYLKGKAEWGQKFQLALSADNLGRYTGSGGNRRSSDPQVRYAWVAQEFKTDGGKHTIKLGLQKPYFMRSESLSSSKRMTTTTAVAADLAADHVAGRDMALTYGYKGSAFGVYVNLVDPSRSDSRNRDWQFSVRAETGLSADTTVKKLTESFLGKEGFHHLLGVGVGMEILSSSSANDDEDGDLVIAADYTLHWNALTAVFDLGLLEQTDNSGMTFAAGAAWSIPMESGVIEPALRLQLVDLNEDDTTGDQGASRDFGGDDGTYAEFSLNYYMAGHDNKLQVALSSYTPEEGDGDAIGFRIQHQLNF